MGRQECAVVLTLLASALATPLAAQEAALGRKAYEAVKQQQAAPSARQDAASRVLGVRIADQLLDRMTKESVARKRRAAAGADSPGAAGDSKLANTPAPPTVIVRMKDPALQHLSEQNLPLPDSVLADLSRVAGVPLLHLRAMSGKAHVLRVGRNLSRPEYDSLLQALRSHPTIDAVSADEVVHAQLVPNDPYVFLQWSIMKRTTTTPYFGVDAISAWDITQGAPGIVVAVVDTGVRPHPDFAARRLPGYDFVSNPASSNDGDGRDADATDPGDYRLAAQCPGLAARNSTWHGTHVTGIIAASGNDASGVAGLDWNARVLPVRALGACGGTWSDIIDAMRWAAGLPVPGVPVNPYPAHVINMSLGGPGRCDTDFLQPAVNEVVAQGAHVVVAAGNDDEAADRYVPASCQGVMTVGATNWDGEKASYSNWSGIRVHIAAPGGDRLQGSAAQILSTVNTGMQGPAYADWDYKQGTSMAAPHVSGIASLMLAANKDLSAAEIFYLLLLTAEPFPWWTGCAALGLCGAGVASASGAVAVATLLRPFALVYEFRNSLTNHYFRTGWTEEAKWINRGGAGPGWFDTLDYFYIYREPQAGTLPVCRFYSAGFNSHFYTIDPGECEFVKHDTNWHYEGIAFHSITRGIGGCPADSHPVYRVYNDRFAQNDVNHRFTTSAAVYAEMQQQGWRPEGIAFCAPG